jgi:hypothetical protein
MADDSANQTSDQSDLERVAAIFLIIADSIISR